MHEFLVGYSEHERQLHITNQEGLNRRRARRQELRDSATQMMVDGGFYDGRLWGDLLEDELIQGLEKVAGVDVHHTSDEDFWLQIFRAIVAVQNREVLQMRSLWKYLASSVSRRW